MWLAQDTSVARAGASQLMLYIDPGLGSQKLYINPSGAGFLERYGWLRAGA